MERALEQLLSAVEAALSELGRETIARLRGDPDASEPEEIFGRHGWLFGKSAEDLLGELDERRAWDEPLRSAVYAHLGELARERGLCAMRRSLASLPDRPLGLAELDVSLREGIVELRGPGERARKVALERGIARVAGRVAGPVTSRLAEAADAEHRFRRRATADVDVIEPDVATRARELLDETDELADEALDFLRGRIGGELRTPFDLARALRAAELDDLVPLRSRATRTAEMLRPARLDERLARRARIERAEGELLPRASLLLPAVEDVRIVGAANPGIVGELEMLRAVGRALSVLHAHPGAPTPLRRPRAGVMGRLLGAWLARAAFEPRLLARAGGVPAAILDRGRRVAASATLFALRGDAAVTLARAGADAGEAFARALRLEMPAELAGLLVLSRAAEVRFDATRAGIGLHRAFRERFDEDYLRGRDAPEILRSMLARVTVEPPARAVRELEVPARIEPEMRSFFEGRLR